MSKPVFDPAIVRRMHDAPYPSLCVRDGMVYDYNSPAYGMFKELFHQQEPPLPLAEFLSPEATENFALLGAEGHQTGRMKSEWKDRNYHVDFKTEGNQTLMLFIPLRRMDDNHLPQFMMSLDVHIRNQLAPLLGALERLTFSADRKDEATLAYLSEARRNVFSLLRLANNLRDSAKCFDGLDYADPERIDMRKLCRKITGYARQSAAFSGVSVKFSCPEEEFWISAESEKVERILLNLLSNAICHSEPEQTVTVSLSRQNDRILMTVRDEGSGIPREILHGIFEKYRHFSLNDCSPGLGLALSAHYAEQHDSAIFMDSTEGKGTAVTVAFPAAEEDSYSLSAPELKYEGSFPSYLVELADLPHTGPLYGPQKDLDTLLKKYI